MILYFSATGNCKWVASRIAAEGEAVLSIKELTDERQFTIDANEETLGIISPTYNWTLPSIVSEFLEKVTIKFKVKPYLFYIGTFGTSSGASCAMANRIMRKKGLPFDGIFDVRMPDTWTPTYDLSDPEEVARTNSNADAEIDAVKAQIAGREGGRYLENPKPLIAGEIGKWLYDHKTRNTSNLSADENCIGCGLCAKKCPAHAIQMVDKRPKWVIDKCIMCLGCLHRCPKFAIRYGDGVATKAHGQYVHPGVKL